MIYRTVPHSVTLNDPWSHHYSMLNISETV